MRMPMTSNAATDSSSWENRLPSKRQTQLVVLAPAETGDSTFENVQVEPQVHRMLLNRMQRFRAQIALDEAAIRRDQLTADGRHDLEVDHRSWHLVLTENERVVGSMRYAAYANTTAYSDLQVRQSWLARTPDLGFDLKHAVEATLEEARRREVHFGEPGGWVLAPELRNTREAIRLALGAFALAWNLGGAVGLCTATQKNNSAAMLRRLGGRPLRTAQGELPAYFEPHYGCEMEVLRFDSWSVNPTYQSAINELSSMLSSDVPVIAAGPIAGLGRLAAAVNSYQTPMPETCLAQ